MPPTAQDINNLRLLRAAMRGYLKDAMQAIHAGADINCQDCNRQTPLHLASLRNHLDLVDSLLYLGARADVEDFAGDTASSLASKMGNCAIVAAIHRAAKQRRANRRCKTEPDQEPYGPHNAEAAISRCFPASIAPAFIQTGQVPASQHESVSVLFLEVVDYSAARGAMPPAAVFDMLCRFIDALDALAAHHGMERIDAFDGCYMAATNYSARQPADHAVRLARFALAAVAAAAALPVDPQRPELGCIRLLADAQRGGVRAGGARRAQAHAARRCRQRGVAHGEPRGGGGGAVLGGVGRADAGAERGRRGGAAADGAERAAAREGAGADVGVLGAGGAGGSARRLDSRTAPARAGVPGIVRLRPPAVRVGFRPSVEL